MTRRLPRDAGTVSFIIAIGLLAVVLIAGLVVDDGGRLREIQRAQNLAAEAARAGGQAIVAGQAISGGAKVVDPTAAVAAARAYLSAAGVTGTVSVARDRRHLTVTVTIIYHTLILGIVGKDRFPVTGSATAVLVTT
jgi:hypothetical protein